MTDIKELIERIDISLNPEVDDIVKRHTLAECRSALSHLAAPLPEEIAALLTLKEGLPDGPWSSCDSLFVYGTPEPSIELLADTFDERATRAFVALPSLFAALERMARQDGLQRRALESDHWEIKRLRANFAAAASQEAEQRMLKVEAEGERDRLRAENELLTAAPLPDEVTDALERAARDAKMVRECNAALGKRIAELEAENEELTARLQDEVASLSSLLMVARESERALASAVAKREEEIAEMRDLIGGLKAERDSIRQKTIGEALNAVYWFHNVSRYTLADIASRIRAILGETETKS